ncbi:hypothetical protein C8R46DRAFT_1001740 [Mycena filopes]|nr:hypothetical protein C8R46DRAFT_1001740 [Mycena filopes]
MRFSFSALSLALVGTAAAAPSLQQILGFLQQFSDDFTYPRIIEVAKGINYTGFTEDVVGRVDITETFVGQELNTEYFFGLFAGLANSNSTPLIGIPLNGTLTNLVVDNNFVLTTTVRDFNWTVGVFPLVWELKFMFNDAGLVTQYDAVLVHASALFAQVWPKLAKHLIVELGLPADTSDTVALQTRAAIDICSTHETYCLGPNQQYNSTKSCMDFVLHQIPFGEGWQGGQNSAFCRYIHTPMIAFRPSVHCPHVGPSGGDMCFDHPYETTVQDPFPQKFVALPNNLTLADLGL